ncbi:DegT/DnrJ/EryC1/StrS family aminotransferase [Myxococcota bacterium]|nr:DegT/DnrJ/EryC1/StrS family aminotransferase [Myxococcota bacterium]
MLVPLMNLRLQYAAIRDEVREAMDEVLDAQRLVGGPRVDAFEAAVAELTGVPHALSCASGSDGVLLMLWALGIGPGDEVICPTFTFFATCEAVSRLGATPVFADLEDDTFNVDPGHVESLITPRTRGIVAVHLFGQLARMEALLAVGDRHGIPVVEDAAQALGTRRDGRAAGAWGRAGSFSFFPTKNLGAYGDGGMVVSSDDALAERVGLLRQHGIAPRKYFHRLVGANSRLDHLQAAVLGVKLRHLPAWNAARARNAGTYARLFEEAGLLDHVRLPAVAPGNEHTYHQYVVRVRDRDALQAHLTRAGIGCEVYYPLPCHLQECYADLPQREGSCPRAEAACREVLALPVFPELTVPEQEEVVGAIAAFYPDGRSS